MYNHGGYLDKGPGLVKGWTDVRDLPRPPKIFRKLQKLVQKHQEGEK